MLLRKENKKKSELKFFPMLKLTYTSPSFGKVKWECFYKSWIT